MRTKIGYGIFMWMSPERRSGRYGYVFMADSDFNRTTTVEATQDTVKYSFFLGKKVRLIAKVLETRKSGHDGDLFLEIKPSTPMVGEEIELGVGIFSQTYSLNETQLGLEPNDGREINWIDPRILYRLHDQTVELYIEETDDDFSPAANLKVREGEAISFGDGSFQIRGAAIQEGDKIKPKSIRLGPGLFSLSSDFEAGEVVEFFRNSRQ